MNASLMLSVLPGIMSGARGMQEITKVTLASGEFRAFTSDFAVRLF
jgi:hypothetical protein